jgi:hypothetical protein
MHLPIDVSDRGSQFKEMVYKKREIYVKNWKKKKKIRL